MRNQQKSAQVKDINGEMPKIVKHSNEFSVELPTLETTDSMERQIHEQGVSQNNVTPKRWSKGRGKVVEGENLDPNQNPIGLSVIESHSSSLTNSIERTTAPSSILGSLSRSSSHYEGSNLSPTAGFQTPHGRSSKKRNISCSLLDDNPQVKNGESFNASMGARRDGALGGGTSGTGGNLGSAQVNGSVLLSAVLQVIASIQKMKGGGTNINSGIGSNVNGGDHILQGRGAGSNSAVQILGSKLPGVPPATAALALAYSLSVAASASAGSGNKGVKGSGNPQASLTGQPVPSEEASQNVGQLLSERLVGIASGCGVEGLENIKVNGELLQSIAASLGSVVASSQSEVPNAVGAQKRVETAPQVMYQAQNKHIGGGVSAVSSSASACECGYGSSACNLNLPPMDFIINENKQQAFQEVKSYPDLKDISPVEIPALTEMDSFQQQSSLEKGNDFGNGDESTAFNESTTGAPVFEDGSTGGSKRPRNDPFSLVCSEIIKNSIFQIPLVSSNNCIWNDISYNHAFEHFGFEIPFSRNHAYLRNELLLRESPRLEVEFDSGEFYSQSSDFPIESAFVGQKPAQTTSGSIDFLGSESHHIHQSQAPKYPSNYDAAFNQRLNPGIQSFCDDLLVSSSNKRNNHIFNSINYLMQIVGNNQGHGN
ncbi:hypothetical protein HWI79_2896 [Cryptosporidium felis]|nr:hypothetical protein HWI79_2896 [Cryptosporidium felis]